MKLKLVTFSILLGLIGSMVIACQQQFQPETYTDDMGRAVTIDEVPQRIVSHVPSITEILFALGLDEKVVGVSDYCDYPPEAKAKPSVGNYFDPSIEKIIELDPDLVLTDGQSEGILKELDGLGTAYLVIDPKNIDHILRDIELLGKILGAEERARKVTGDMQNKIADIVNQVKDARHPRVFYVFDAADLTQPWTAGPGSFADSLITMAGGENIAASAQDAWVQFSIEEVVSADPEIIIIDAAMGTASIEPAKLKENPVWGEITAVKQDRIFIADGDLVNRSGPRIIQGLEEMAKFIHPELFD